MWLALFLTGTFPQPTPTPIPVPPPPLHKKAIKRDRVNFVVLNTVNNSKFLFLKTRKANYVSVLFLSDIAFKALLTIQVNMFLFDWAIYK